MYINIHVCSHRGSLRSCREIFVRCCVFTEFELVCHEIVWNSLKEFGKYNHGPVHYIFQFVYTAGLESNISLIFF